jgi:Fe-S cluster assembly protein SufD
MITAANRELARRWSDEIGRAAFDEAAPWLRELRDSAVMAFASGGLPHRKVEAWKYTPLRLLEARAPALPAERPEPAAVDAPQPIVADAPRVLSVDGEPVSVEGTLPDGVRWLTLREALERHEDPIREMAQRVGLGGPTHAFSALNTAFIDRARVVHVAAGVDAGRLLLHWAFSGQASDRLDFARLFILLDDGARLDLIEQYESTADATGTLNVMLQARLGRGAELALTRVQRESDAAMLLTATSVEQGADSRFRYHGFDLGGGLVRHELYAELMGEGASCDLGGACVLDRKRHGETRISVDHAAPNCVSEQFFRGVLGGRSRGVFNGRALIREGADGSSVRQSNANLLLSPLAEMDTKPELEIYADEVEASHGATVGQLDESAVFYLRSRGLGDAEARRMLTSAFCHAVSDRLADRDLAETIGALLDNAMPASD